MISRTGSGSRRVGPDRTQGRCLPTLVVSRFPAGLASLPVLIPSRTRTRARERPLTPSHPNPIELRRLTHRRWAKDPSPSSTSMSIRSSLVVPSRKTRQQLRSSYADPTCSTRCRTRRTETIALVGHQTAAMEGVCRGASWAASTIRVTYLLAELACKLILNRPVYPTCSHTSSTIKMQ